jgi:uncharacterized membrane protein
MFERPLLSSPVEILQHVPCITVVGALVLLAWGLLRHSLDVTLAALTAVVLAGLIAVPLFLKGPRGDADVSAIIGLEAASAVALAALFVWRSTRRFPLFPAAATLALGVAASILVIRAAM